MAVLIGTGDADTLPGGGGAADLVLGLGGNDRAAGGGGGDLILGGAGDDSLAGDGTALFVNFDAPSGDDLIFGGDGNDTISGDSFFYNGPEGGTNTLFGGAGNDAITGGYGADTISGDSGDDFIRGYGAAAPSPGGTASLRDRDLADLLLGGSGNDTIEGGGGRDTIDGGTGDDRLVGGAGVDALTGGPGADRFVFAPTGATGLPPDTGQGEGNRDVVTDFRPGEDLLDLSGYPRDDLNVRWEYDAAGDRTIVTYEDPRGAAFFPDLQIELAGVRDLSLSDIIA